MIYGLAKSASAGGFGAPEVLGARADRRARCSSRSSATRCARRTPLIDLRLFKNRTFAVVLGHADPDDHLGLRRDAAAAALPAGVRGESAFDSGLLLAPQGIGAMIAMPIAGRLTDKTGVGKIVLLGPGDRRGLDPRR